MNNNYNYDVKKFNTELLQNKLSKLSLMDSLLQLREYKNKASAIHLKLFTEKDPHIEFVYQKKICQSLIQSIKNQKDELSLARYRIQNDSALNDIKSKSNSDDSKDKNIKAFIFNLQTTAYEIIGFARRLDNIQTDNIFPFNGGNLTGLSVNAFKELFFTKGFIKNVKKEYDLFLLKLCRSVKNIISKLDDIHSVKNIKDDGFDIDFAEYYLKYLSRDIKKEKDFDVDITAMNNLYKKIYKIIDQLEKFI